MKKIILLTFALLSSFVSLSADWEYEYVGETSARIQDMNITENHIFLYGEDFIHKYDRELETWTNIDKPTSGRLRSFIGYSNTLIVADFYGGNFISSNNGKDWDYLSGISPNIEIKELADSKDYVYALGYVVSQEPDEFTALLLRMDKETHEWNDVYFDYATFSNLTASEDRIAFNFIRNETNEQNTIMFSENKKDNYFKDHFAERIENYIYGLEIKGDTLAAYTSKFIYLSLDNGMSWDSIGKTTRWGYITFNEENFYMMDDDTGIISYDYQLNIKDTFKIDKEFDFYCRKFLRDLDYNDGKLYMASTYGLFVYDIENKSTVNLTPNISANTFDDFNFVNDSLFLFGRNREVFAKGKYSGNWVKKDIPFSTLEMTRYKIRSLENELHFVASDNNDSTITISKVNNSGNWESMELSKYWYLRIEKLQGKYYFSDGIDLYITTNGDKIDTISTPRIKNSDTKQTISDIIAFDNKIIIRTNESIYRLNEGTEEWVEILSEKSQQIEQTRNFYSNEDRLFVNNTAEDGKRILYEYNLSSDLFEIALEVNPTSYAVKLPSLFWHGDTFFWARNDTLYMTSDNGATIEKHQLPEQIRSAFIFQNEIYLNTYFNLYKRSITDFGLTDVEETESHNLNLFAYPQPAKDELVIDIVDASYAKLTLADITIYDYTGSEIATKDNLTIETINSGYSLTWDCSAEQAGVYIIRINHVAEEKAVKVVVE